MMEAARSYIAAGAALATATGLIAAAPVVTAPALPDVEVPAVQLAGISDNLQDLLQGFNDFVLNTQLAFNPALVQGEVGLEQLIFHTDSALNGVVNRLYNVFNMGLSADENWLNGVIGIRPGPDAATVTPAFLTWNLLAGQNAFGDDAPNVFNSGHIGGLEGMFVQDLQAFANVTGIPGDAVAAGINTGLLDVNIAVVNGLLGFNNFLTQNIEIGFEKLIAPLFLWLDPSWTADSLFNGALNRAFDTFNMMLDAGQQGFLGALGATFSPIELTSSLLTTAGHTLSDGTIGGLEGVLAQGYMYWADLFGMFFPSP